MLKFIANEILKFRHNCKLVHLKQNYFLN